jgi:hypothetical protein
MKRLAATSAFLTALCLPALADPDNGNGNKYGWDNPITRTIAAAEVTRTVYPAHLLALAFHS